MAGNSVLRRVVEFKYLGVTMDECLNWKAQASAVFSKASTRIGMLRRIRNDITVNAADKVYKSFILLILDYCGTVYGPAVTKAMLKDVNDYRPMLQRSFTLPVMMR